MGRAYRAAVSPWGGRIGLLFLPFAYLRSSHFSAAGSRQFVCNPYAGLFQAYCSISTSWVCALAWRLCSSVAGQSRVRFTSKFFLCGLRFCVLCSLTLPVQLCHGPFFASPASRLPSLFSRSMLTLLIQTNNGCKLLRISSGGMFTHTHTHTHPASFQLI